MARYVNKAFAEVTGEIVSRGAGYGLEIPYVYHVYGPKTYIIKLKELTDSLKAAEYIQGVTILNYYFTDENNCIIVETSEIKIFILSTSVGNKLNNIIYHNL